MTLRKSLTTFLFVASLSFVLTGCVTSAVDTLKTDMATKGVAPLTGPEIKTAFSGMTASGDSGKGWQFARYSGSDGSLKVRVWGSGEDKSDKGEWRINEEGMMCTKYFGRFSKSGERCSMVYPGESSGEYITAIVKGKKSKRNPSGIYYQTMSQGDTSGVK